MVDGIEVLYKLWEVAVEGFSEIPEDNYVGPASMYDQKCSREKGGNKVPVALQNMWRTNFCEGQESCYRNQLLNLQGVSTREASGQILKAGR